MSYIVVTHSGKAHMDELLAISLLAIYKESLPKEIIRVKHDEASVILKENRENHFFIDCGLEYKPLKGYFDHHQSKDLDSSAKLVFDQYFKHLKDTNLYEFTNLVSEVDTKGPNALDDFKLNSPSINYFSFSGSILLKQFEKNPIEIIELYTKGIKEIIEFEVDKKKAKLWFEESENKEIITIDGVNVLQYKHPIPADLSRAMKSIDKEIVEENNIHVIYGYDKEDNNIRTLYRTPIGDKVVDFVKASVEETLFCHKGGFLLRFKPATDNEWEKIISQGRTL